MVKKAGSRRSKQPTPSEEPEPSPLPAIDATKILIAPGYTVKPEVVDTIKAIEDQLRASTEAFKAVDPLGPLAREIAASSARYDAIIKQAETSSSLARETVHLVPSREVQATEQVAQEVAQVANLLAAQGEQVAAQAALAREANTTLLKLLATISRGQLVEAARQRTANILTVVLVGATVLIAILTVALIWLTWLLATRPTA